MENSLPAILSERLPKLSKGHKKIAEYILNHYDKAAFMTASKLGNIVGVSESTVVRFATSWSTQEADIEYLSTLL